MEKSVASSYYGFGILPTKDMGVAFMSPEFLRHYEHAVETASRLGLKMCLYDEYWFPSGSAGGLLGKQYPEALGKRLDKLESNVVGPDTITLDVPAGELMAAVAMNAETKQKLDPPSNCNWIQYPLSFWSVDEQWPKQKYSVTHEVLERRSGSNSLPLRNLPDDPPRI